MHRRVFTLLALLTLCFSARAATIHVPGDYATIQTAIGAAKAGDEIIVAPGIYKGRLTIDKDIILRSTFSGDWNAVHGTVIDGDSNSLYISGSVSAQCILRGFTIQNTHGLLCGGAHATIEYCIFQNNNNSHPWMRYDGGAIEECHGVIQNSFFMKNKANYGGALANCHGVIQNNVFHGNVGLSWSNYPAPHTWPLTWSGAGGVLYNCDGIVRNNTFFNNLCHKSYAPYIIPGGLYECNGTIVNNIFYHTEMTTQSIEWESSSAPQFCLFRENRQSTGCLAGDPKFVDPAHGDFHLMPDSPCIDAGKLQADLKKDLDGHQRGIKALPGAHGDGSNVDIGAFEFMPRPLMLWFDGGAPVGAAEGRTLAVRWYRAPGAGISVGLRLNQYGRLIGELGRFDATPGTGSVQVRIPTSLLTSGHYRIMGYDPGGAAVNALSPEFSITGSKRAGMDGRAWRKYR